MCRTCSIPARLRRLGMGLVLALAVGAAAGLAGGLFSLCLEGVTAFRAAHGWIIWLLPAGAALIAWLYSRCDPRAAQGTDLILLALRGEAEVPGCLAPLIAAATALTHLVGGSAGREGAALQLGGGLGQQLGRWLRLRGPALGCATRCGMSAAFAALFGTPLTAAVFAVEVSCVGAMAYGSLLPCLASALVARGVAGAVGAGAEAFPLGDLPPLTLLSAGGIAVLGALCAGVGALFCRLLHQTAELLRRRLPQPCRRAALGGAAVLAAALILGRDYLGAGIPVIQRALGGAVRPEAFALKMLFTAVTLGCGMKGGEIVPTLFVGATFGALVGQLLGMPMDLCGACGMAALFSAVTRCPMAALCLSLELFGSQGMGFYALAVAAGFAFRGREGLYHSQLSLEAAACGGGQKGC